MFEEVGINIEIEGFFSCSTFFFYELTQVAMLLSFLKLGHVKEISGRVDESSALLYSD